MDKKPILSVKGLQLSFEQNKVITNLDIDLYEGEILAVVGSSGSGKSLLAHSILGILPDNAVMEGKIEYEGKIMSREDIENRRGSEIVLIPQSVNYLDPLMKVKNQIEISLKGNRKFKYTNKRERARMIRELLQRYDLSAEVEEYYPHQLSGGMARKVLLCTALAADSRIIIADEPTPGLDEPSLNEVLQDFRGLADANKAVLMITHDINAALQIADRIAIFYAGSTIEIANVKDFANRGMNLRHPYTKMLFQALPSEDFIGDKGTQPLPMEITKGCSFYDRCPVRESQCKKNDPDIQELRDGKVRCWNAT